MQETEKFISLCLTYDKLYIYGATENQELLARYLHICGVDIKGFLVSVSDGESLRYAEYPKILLNDFTHDNKTAVILGLSDKYYNEVYPTFQAKGTKVIFLTERAKQVIAYKLRPRRPDEFNVEFNLTDHCNLHCQMCDHFSQIAKEGYLDLSAFEKDIIRISELAPKLGAIKLLGGEPLLHPKALAFCSIARKYFPDTPVKFYTNGILLLDKTQSEFWKACCEHDISIELTQYPISMDIERIKDKAYQEKVELNVFSEEANHDIKEVKHSLKFQLDPTGQQPLYGFVDCYQMNNCNVLSNGKLYLCPTSACIGHFNSYFGQKLLVSERDYIDIHAAHSFREIADFACRPVPFCRYCDVGHREFHQWSASRRKIEEYI